MMRDAVLHFNEQFAFEPTVVHDEKLPAAKRFLVLGMGGSHLAADLLLAWKPEIPMTIHSDYGLPAGDLRGARVIASSYSGNTEEILDGAEAAQKKNVPMCVIATGGKLLQWAKKHSVPYSKLPDTGIQPRSALGYSIIALLRCMNLPDGLKEAHKLAASLSPKEHEKEGTELATHLKGRVPIIYASTRNRAVAYNWKIKCNETGKIPAFMNVVPELNHNEMNGFDVRPATKKLSNHFHWILLHDTEDDERVQKRMAMLERMLFDRGFRTTGVDFDGATRFDRIFRSLLVADWFAVATATQYGLDATDVPMVEEFKHLITE